MKKKEHIIYTSELTGVEDLEDKKHPTLEMIQDAYEVDEERNSEKQ
ncbi:MULTISPECIES: hypothetical protein [Bacillaceae]|nr:MULTISPECIES: hypothetical protein [Bacillaceae]UOE93694.1 hypothetical protein MM271_21340 [Alkalihalobacillus sp. LMS39]